MLVPPPERIVAASAGRWRRPATDEVIEPDSLMKFSVMVLTAVETVDNSADASEHRETTHV